MRPIENKNVQVRFFGIMQWILSGDTQLLSIIVRSDIILAVFCKYNHQSVLWAHQSKYVCMLAIKSECPLSSSQSWHMMKNQNFSYSSQR